MLIKSKLSSTIPTYFMFLLHAPVSFTGKLKKLYMAWFKQVEKVPHGKLKSITASKCYSTFGIKDVTVFNKVSEGMWLSKFDAEENAFLEGGDCQKYGVLEERWRTRSVSLLWVQTMEKNLEGVGMSLKEKII